MSPTGHNLTAAALGAAAAYPLYLHGDPLTAALWFAGAMLGGRAPDWMELFRWEGGIRYSLIPHRTLTHWPPLWLGLLIAALVLVPEAYREPAVAFVAAGWLHLLLDFLTPSGVPLLNPFGRRVSLRVYRAGAFLPETAIVLGTWGLALGALMPAAAHWLA